MLSGLAQWGQNRRCRRICSNYGVCAEKWPPCQSMTAGRSVDRGLRTFRLTREMLDTKRRDTLYWYPNGATE